MSGKPAPLICSACELTAAADSLNWDTDEPTPEPELSTWNDVELIAEVEPGIPDCDMTSGGGSSSTCSAVGPCTCALGSCGYSRDDTHYLHHFTLNMTHKAD